MCLLTKPPFAVTLARMSTVSYLNATHKQRRKILWNQQAYLENNLVVRNYVSRNDAR